MDKGIKWYAVRLETEDECMEITEHLAMNGYTYDTNCEKTIFIYEEEVEYLETILNDRGYEYCIL